MSTEDKGSVTDWVGILKSGGDVDAAARGLWQRYFGRLVDLARAKLPGKRRPGGRPDRGGRRGEPSSARSFLRGAVAGRYPDLGDREGPLAAAGHDHGPQGEQRGGGRDTPQPRGWSGR